MNEEITLQVGEAKITLPAQAVLASFLEKLGMQIKQPLPNPARPELREGEHYAGIIIGKNGEPDYHLILLPGESININWQDAKDWAAAQGGELPTRREQSLLFANLRDEFQPRWHWSCEEHADDAHSAWCQDFSGGNQYDNFKGTKGCARAARRVAIKDAAANQKLVAELERLASDWVIESCQALPAYAMLINKKQRELLDVITKAKGGAQ